MIANLIILILAYKLGAKCVQLDWYREEVEQHEDTECRACTSIHAMYHQRHHEA